MAPRRRPPSRALSPVLSRPRATAPSPVEVLPAAESSPAAAALSSAEDPIDSRQAEALVERFREVRRQGMRTLVDVAVEAGQVLMEGQRLLRGSYGRWLRERVGLEASTARNYLSMARLAAESPWVIERYKELGASKLYQVARLPAERRRSVLAAPGLDELNDRQFVALVRPQAERQRKVTGNMRAHGLRQKLQSFTRTVESARLGRVEDAELRRGLMEDLRTLRRAAEALMKRLG